MEKTKSFHYYFVTFCAISYHLHILKNVKNTHKGVKPFTRDTIFELYKWHQIAQNITFINTQKDKRLDWDCQTLTIVADQYV